MDGEPGAPADGPDGGPVKRLCDIAASGGLKYLEGWNPPKRKGKEEPGSDEEPADDEDPEELNPILDEEDLIPEPDNEEAPAPVGKAPDAEEAPAVPEKLDSMVDAAAPDVEEAPEVPKKLDTMVDVV